MFAYSLRFKKHLRLDVVFYEVIHNHVVAELGKVQGSCLVLGEDIAVCSILQEEAHYICISSPTCLIRPIMMNVKLLIHKCWRTQVKDPNTGLS